MGLFFALFSLCLRHDNAVQDHARWKLGSDFAGFVSLKNIATTLQTTIPDFSSLGAVVVDNNDKPAKFKLVSLDTEFKRIESTGGRGS